MNNILSKTYLLPFLLTTLILHTNHASAATKAKLMLYGSSKATELAETWGDNNPNDNSRIRSNGFNKAFFHNTSVPDNFRRGRSNIAKQTATGAKLYPNGDIEVAIDYSGASETRIVANINVTTNVLSEGSSDNSAGKPTLVTITDSDTLCVLNDSNC